MEVFTMHQVTIHEAKTHLSKLIQEALNGETVIIAKGKIPLIKLEVLAEAKQKRRIGGASKLNLKMDDDFNAPLNDFSSYS
jgi:antitoxin (DNA-binding transcriptional repressor) of toxin-antitoxin stability system